MAIIGIKADTNRIRLEEHIPLDTPLRVIIDPSSICNFHCQFCPHGNRKVMKTMPQAIMSAELAKKCIDDLTAFPHKIKKLLFAQIGEPLVNKNLPEIVAYASKKDVAEQLCITTNASLLTADLAQQLIAAGMSHFDISLYGINSSQYLEFCGYSIDFDSFYENIKYLYSIKENAHITLKITDAVCNTKADKERFHQMFSPICDTICIEHVVPIWYQLENSIEDDGINIYGNPVSRKDICPIPFYTLAVQATGIVGPCANDWNGRLFMGNACNESLYSIWNGEKFRSFRCTLLRKGCSGLSPCDSCKAQDMCALDNIDPYREELLNRLEDK